MSNLCNAGYNLQLKYLFKLHTEKNSNVIHASNGFLRNYLKICVQFAKWKDPNMFQMFFV